MKYFTYTNSAGNSMFYYEVNNTRVSFGISEDNTDYQAYLKWLAEGNTPQPAENA